MVAIPHLQGLRARTLLGGLLLALAVLVVALLATSTSEAEVVDLKVPYHRQVESWYCAEASLQMVFDYWGEEIPQHDIGDVANERSVGGTYASDLVRAARFSNVSTAIQYREEGGPRLQGYDQRPYGYAAHVNQWSGGSDHDRRYSDLMDLVRDGYPVILLTWFDVSHGLGHYRVVKGFDTDTGDFLVHDPQLGPSQRFNMTLLVDDLWHYYDRWGLVVVPWSVELDAPEMVGPGRTFEVSARVVYECPGPLLGRDSTHTWPQGPTATATVPPPFSLHEGSNASQALNITRGGDSDLVSWTIVSPQEAGMWTASVGVKVEATTRDQSISYGWYNDVMGGEGAITVSSDGTPPVVERFDVAGGEELLREPEAMVNWSVSDVHSGVHGLRLSLDDGETWTAWLPAEGSHLLALGAGDGPYTVTYQARDLVGNRVRGTADVFLDTTPPIIALFQLAGGREVVTTRTIPVSLRAEDESTQVELMSLRLDGGAWLAWEPYREGLELELPGDGQHTVDLRIRDTLGHVATATDSVILDTTPPYITRLEIVNGTGLLRTRRVAVAFSAFDNLDDSLEYSLGTGTAGGLDFDPERTIASGGELILEWTFDGEGGQVLTLWVRDMALHIAEETIEVTVDSEPPLVTLVLNAGLGIARTTRVPLSITAEDRTTDVGKARIRVNSNEWGPWSDPVMMRQVDLGPGEGQRWVHLEVLDLAGNVARVSASIWVDTELPTAEVAFTHTEPGGVVAAGSSIVVTFSEPMDNTTVEVVLMDNSSGLLECELAWEEGWTVLNITPARPLARGAHFALQVQGNDLNGNPLEFPGVVFSTPEREDDDWQLTLDGGAGVMMLIVILVIAAIIALGYGIMKSRM